MQVTQESLFLTLTNGNSFASTFASFATSLLGVNVSYIEVMDLTVDPGTAITSTTQASVSVRGDFIVAPADSYSAEMVSHEPVLGSLCMDKCRSVSPCDQELVVLGVCTLMLQSPCTCIKVSGNAKARHWVQTFNLAVRSSVDSYLCWCLCS